MKRTFMVAVGVAAFAVPALAPLSVLAQDGERGGGRRGAAEQNGGEERRGPRPERPELIESFKEEIPHYNVRHNIKPGVTGWAQVNGLRGDTCLRERVKFDLDYIENWNFLLDFQIMVMTFFSRKGAC